MGRMDGTLKLTGVVQISSEPPTPERPIPRETTFYAYGRHFTIDEVGLILSGLMKVLPEDFNAKDMHDVLLRFAHAGSKRTIAQWWAEFVWWYHNHRRDARLENLAVGTDKNRTGS